MPKEKINRPSGYQYYNILKEHLGNDFNKIFNGKLVYPRQLEIHLPADHKKRCNFNCYFCQGNLLERPLAYFEMDALELLEKLKGSIPYHIYGGAYSEPLLNPYFMAFLSTTKKYGSYFGIHTNGSLLKTLEETQGMVTELCHISNSNKDYLSISLDAGSAQSHMKVKGLSKNWYDEIIEGIRMAVKIRGNCDKPAIRVCYLLNRFNSSKKEIKNIVKIMKDIKVDSLKFSIPYDLYGKDFSKVKEYKKNVEMVEDKKYIKMLKPYLSKSSKERPYIFYISPDSQDVEKMNFRHCIYCYYQITFAADGYVYKCSSTATPSFKMNRLGKITNDLDKFNKMILKNQDKNFNPSCCFKVGARCNRMALEVNNRWQKDHEKN